MRQRNTLSDRLESGDVVFGAQTVTHEPNIVEAYGDMGLDFVWVDLEHIGPAPYDGGIFEDLTRAADVSETELLVRIPRNEPPLIRKVLDSGVRNILIPRLETAEEVRQAVEASRFSYNNGVGERGIAGSRSSGWGSELNQEYVDVEDRNTSVGVMIENTTAVKNLEEILRVEGLEFIVIGPADLSVSLGHPLDYDNPELRDVIAQIRETSKSHEVPFGRLSSSTEQTKEMISNGAQMIRVSSGEIDALRSVIQTQLEVLDDSDDV